MNSLFTVAGSVVGMSKGLLNALWHGTKVTSSAAASTTTETIDKTITRLYTLAGACAGLLAGAHFALLSFWWGRTNDDIKMKVLQSSPIKYQLQGLKWCVSPPPKAPAGHSNDLPPSPMQFEASSSAMAGGASQVESFSPDSVVDNAPSAGKKQLQGRKKSGGRLAPKVLSTTA